MIKVKTEKVNELTEKFGFTSENHPQLGLIFVHKDGLVFGPQGQFLGMAMPMPLLTAKLVSDLYVADMFMEDTGLVTQAPKAPPQAANQIGGKTASRIIL